MIKYLPIFKIFILLNLFHIKSINSLIAGIDFGGEFFKVALVKPGAPFEIVTNIHSHRKTESIVAFDGRDRLYGADAANILIRKPKQAFTHIKRYLGNDINHPQVVALTEFEYSSNDILANLTRGGAVQLKHKSTVDDEERVFHAEEIAAMVFSHAKDITNAFASANVKDWIVTVPSFFTEPQRQALLDAVDLIGIRVLSLIDENTAAALQLGIDIIKEKPYRVLFYNLGSTSLQVSIVEYLNMTVPDGFRKNKTVGSFTVLAKSWDENLGGSKFDVRLAEHLADEFNTKKLHGKEDVRKIPRVMAKIVAAAKKTKIVLSANEEIPVVIQSLHNDIDFITHMSRTEFERINVDLFDRVLLPVTKALETANLTKSEIDEIEIIGGGVRMPKVRQLLKKYFNGKDLSVHLNGDEAMALGAAFRGANVSKAFIVRMVGMNDITPFAVGVRLVGLRKPDEKDVKGENIKSWVKRATLFSSNHRLDARKSVSFTYDKDISCTFRYDQPSALPAGSSTWISKYNITGIEDFISKMKKEDVEGIPKISLTFHLDASGITTVNKAEAILEKEETIVENAASENEKSEIDNKKKGDEKKESDKIEESDEKEESDKEDIKDKKIEKNEKNIKDEKIEKPKKKKKLFRAVLSVIRADVHNEVGMSILPMSISVKKESVQLLQKMQELDDIRKENNLAKNSLETFAYSTRDVISIRQEEISYVSLPKDVEEILNEVNEIEDWLYDKGKDLSAAEYDSRHNKVKSKLDAILFRANEKKNLPDAVEKSKKFAEEIIELMEIWVTKKPHITEEERKKVSEKIDEMKKWIEDNVDKQAKVAAHETPVFTSSQIIDRMKSIERSVQILSRKPIPPPPAPKKNDTSSDLNSKSKHAANKTKTDESKGSSDKDNTSETSDLNEGEANDIKNEEFVADSEEENINEKDEL